MRITGKGVRGKPKNPEEVHKVFGRAVEPGANFIFIPWLPVATGCLALPGGSFDQLARRYKVCVVQPCVSLAAQLFSDHFAYPGTSSIEHV